MGRPFMRKTELDSAIKFSLEFKKNRDESTDINFGLACYFLEKTSKLSRSVLRVTLSLMATGKYAYDEIYDRFNSMGVEVIEGQEYTDDYPDDIAYNIGDEVYCICHFVAPKQVGVYCYPTSQRDIFLGRIKGINKTMDMLVYSVDFNQYDFLGETVSEGNVFPTKELAEKAFARRFKK